MQHIKKISRFFSVRISFRNTNHEPIQHELETQDEGVKTEFIRYFVTIMIVSLISFIAIVAIFKPTANKILEQLIPLLMLIIGYYYGRKP